MRQMITITRVEKYQMPQDMSGYFLERPIVPRPGKVIPRRYFIIAIRLFGTTRMNVNGPIQTHTKNTAHRIVRLKAVARPTPLTVSNGLQEKHLNLSGEMDGQATMQLQSDPTIALRPVQNGQSYRILSPSACGLVRPELAKALETVFEQFAVSQGSTSEKPLEISLSRGYKANSHGHKEGRAADIGSVGGKTLLQWKQSWDAALESPRKLLGPQQRSEAMAIEQQYNLGYGLYKALQVYGGWQVNPQGWRVYQNVMQLFGPWTATDGPWKAMRIENPTSEQRQRLADQRWVFQAHQDHIHVAR